MTLIVGMVCDDGVVMAADSASTDLSAQIKQITADKMAQLKNYKIVVGGSGSVGVMQNIRASLESYAGAAATVHNVRRDLKKLILPVQKEAVEGFIPMPGMSPHPPSACVLVAGIAGTAPFLLEFEANGEDTNYGDTHGGFCAIGSGKTYAHALFRSHLTRRRDTRLGALLAFRVITDSIEISHFGLAAPVHVFTVTQTGVTLLSKEALQDLATQVDLWRELEGEALGQLMARRDATGDTAAEALEALPAPPAG